MEICISPSLHSGALPLDVAQGGFREQRSTLDQVLCLHELSISHTRITGQPPSICVLDIKSAYDTVDRAVIWRIPECDVLPPLLGLFQILFADVSIEVLISGHASHRFSPITDVLQGSILFPHLYSLYINSYLKHCVLIYSLLILIVILISFLLLFIVHPLVRLLAIGSMHYYTPTMSSLLPHQILCH